MFLIFFVLVFLGVGVKVGVANFEQYISVKICILASKLWGPQFWAVYGLRVGVAPC